MFDVRFSVRGRVRRGSLGLSLGLRLYGTVVILTNTCPSMSYEVSQVSKFRLLLPTSITHSHVVAVALLTQSTRLDMSCEITHCMEVGHPLLTTLRTHWISFVHLSHVDVRVRVRKVRVGLASILSASSDRVFCCVYLAAVMVGELGSKVQGSVPG